MTTVSLNDFNEVFDSGYEFGCMSFEGHGGVSRAPCQSAVYMRKLRDYKFDLKAVEILSEAFTKGFQMKCDEEADKIIKINR